MDRGNGPGMGSGVDVEAQRVGGGGWAGGEATDGGADGSGNVHDMHRRGGGWLRAKAGGGCENVGMRRIGGCECSNTLHGAVMH